MSGLGFGAPRTFQLEVVFCADGPVGTTSMGVLARLNWVRLVLAILEPSCPQIRRKKQRKKYWRTQGGFPWVVSALSVRCCGAEDRRARVCTNHPRVHLSVAVVLGLWDADHHRALRPRTPASSAPLRSTKDQTRFIPSVQLRSLSEPLIR